MRTIYLSMACLICLFTHITRNEAQQRDIIPGELMVMLHQGSEINALIQRFNKEFPGADLHVVRQLSQRIRIWLLAFDVHRLSMQQALYTVNGYPAVAIAQYNHNNLTQRAIPNDALWANQWDMLNDGVNGNISDADIDADSAWSISTGGLTVQGDTIVVAIIDGYFDLTHPDLDWWKNTGEIPNNNTDDDGNGYIDDYNGWSAFTLDDNVQSTASWQSHGTHVSGTVGAIGNNGIGIAGVNWNVKLMPVAGSSTNEATVVAAYAYVLEQRARYNLSNGTQGAYVVSTNSSFGVDYGQPSNYPIWCAFYDSLGAYGILSAGATINSNVDVDAQGDVPTACPSDFMLSVTNTNSSDMKVSFAGYGLTTIDIGAPGDGIWSTVHGGNWEGNGWTGTSMATPHVAGAVALMYSVACQEMFDDFAGNPSGMAMAMRNYIINNGWDANSSLNGITVTGGRLNLHACLMAVKSYANCYNGSGALSPAFTGSVTIRPNPVKDLAVIQYDISTPADVEILVFDALGRRLIREEKGFAFKGMHRQKINFSSLQSGVYLLVLSTSAGMLNAYKVVKL